MPAKITLRVTEGPLKGKEFVFDERTTCVIGRATDCDPQIPDDENHRMISRHHCLLDINPPDIRVRDFGSRNGTYVNGKLIGQREAHMTPEEGAQMAFPEYDLKDRDEITLSNTVFKVSVFVPTLCVECQAEIPESKKAQAQPAPGIYQCNACREKAEREKRKEPLKPKPKVCVKCGRDVAKEIGPNRQGEFVCASCQRNPLKIVEGLLNQAKQGKQGLVAIKGYTILKELGIGGMGAVYLARHDQTGEFVAIKVMLPKIAVESRAKEDFLLETENTRALRHPNVVYLHESGCSDGTFFMVLEYCDGGSIAKLMEDRGGKLAISEACPIILQALDGLEYAHKAEIPRVKLADGRITRGHGLVHRDVKPSNILLSGSARSRIAKIGDYGLGKAFDLAGLSGHTRTGTVAGSPWFMPRQQVINFKYSGPEVDVWAMAASLYNMLTGWFPRDFPRGKDVWQIVLQSKPVAIRKRDPSIPKHLAEVIDTALIDDPDIQFKTAAELKRALERVL